MIEGIEQLRNLKGDCISYRDAINKSLEIADSIEKEINEKYIKRPVDKDGNIIKYDTIIEEWGAVKDIWCEMENDDAYVWYVRGHDMTAPTLRASETTIAKPPTVEDLLKEMYLEIEDAKKLENSLLSVDIIAEYANKLQLKEENEIPSNW